jgi:hydrogenase maturation protease
LAEAGSILVLGVGNLLRCDEGFGVHVVQHLSQQYRPGANVQILDGGTGANALLGAILECDHLIVVDVARMEEKPGTLRRLEGSTLQCVFKAKQSAHDWAFSEILLQAQLLGHSPQVAVIAVEPYTIDAWSPELTPELSLRLPDAIEWVVREVQAAGGELATVV